MVYLLESNLPDKNPVLLALQHVYGIGKFRASLICNSLGFSSNLNVKLLSENQIIRMLTIINSLNLLLAHELKNFSLSILNKLVFIRSYSGLSRNQGLPISGQSTHTNASTARIIK